MNDLQTINLPDVGPLHDVSPENAHKLTHIFCAIALGRAIEDVRVLEQCGRVYWVAYDPVSDPDPELPIILDFGPNWLDALRQWADHLESRPSLYSREQVKQWTRRGQEILAWLSKYARQRLTDEEFQFLVIKLWYDWARGRWHR